MSRTIIRRSSLQQEVTQRLREEIIEGRWRPGTRLQERALCERYGISRSPLREAYQVLASEGLIDILPNKGAIVTAPTPMLTLQSYELLRALEILGVRLACRNASKEQLNDIKKADDAMKRYAKKGDLHEFFRTNNEVHRRIVLAGGNTPLSDTHLVISRQIIRVQNLDGPIEHLASEGVGEHDGIISALFDRDEDLSVKLFSAHLDTVEENLRSRLQEFSDEAAS